MRSDSTFWASFGRLRTLRAPTLALALLGVQAPPMALLVQLYVVSLRLQRTRAREKSEQCSFFLKKKEKKENKFGEQTEEPGSLDGLEWGSRKVRRGPWFEEARTCHGGGYRKLGFSLRIFRLGWGRADERSGKKKKSRASPAAGWLGFIDFLWAAPNVAIWAGPNIWVRIMRPV